MPLEGTTQRPSLDLNLSRPINPLRRAKEVSARVTPRFRKHSRVRLYTQYVRLSMLPLRSFRVPATGHTFRFIPRAKSRLQFLSLTPAPEIGRNSPSRS